MPAVDEEEFEKIKRTFPKRTKTHKVLLATAAGSMLAGTGLLAAGSGYYPPLEYLFLALGFFGGGVVGLVLAILARKNVELSSPTQLAEVFLVGPLGVAVLGLGAIMFANGALDPHELVEARVQVVNKWRSGSGGNDGSHIEVTDWRVERQGKTVSFQVWEPDLYARTVKGSDVVLVAGPGLISWWLKDLRAVPPIQE